MRAILVQFLYEANTFCPKLAGMEIFRQAGTWLTEESEVRAWTGRADSQLSGSLRALEKAGWETRPVFVAFCGSPSGRLTRECFQEIRTTLRERIRQAMPAEAIL